MRAQVRAWRDVPPPPKAVSPRTIGARVWARLRRDRVLQFAIALFSVFALSSALAPWIAPHDPFDLASLDVLDAESPPFWYHNADPRFLLGTDSQGRDLLSTMMYGTGISLVIGLGAVAVQALIGVSVGLAAGYRGGRIDGLLMRLADIQLSLSTLMVAIIALAIFKTAFGLERFATYAVPLLVLVIGLAEWPTFARTVRASVLAEKEKDYVRAAHALGLTDWQVVTKHILPNVASPVLVIATVQIANAIMAEAALSFLGLGMPVSQPSLGALIRNGFEYVLSGAWWITVFPSVALILIILSLNLIGDALRDALNPKRFAHVR